jgi:hypothetical protein
MAFVALELSRHSTYGRVKRREKEEQPCRTIRGSQSSNKGVIKKGIYTVTREQEFRVSMRGNKNNNDG